MRLNIIVFAIVLGLSVAFYDKNGPVTVLTDKNFKDLVLNSGEVWMVEFYAPWCGHCKQMKDDWIKAANAMGGMVRFGAIDTTEEKSLGSQYQIEGFPTIKIFTPLNPTPINYQNQRDAKSFCNAAFRTAKDVARAYLNGDKKSTFNGNAKTETPKKEQSEKKNKVITLTDSTFDELVMNSNQVWMIKFYAPWCGHCKSMAKDWRKAATMVPEGVLFGEVDATVSTTLANRFGIQGYPTIKCLKAGAKSDSDIIDYDQARSTDAFVSFAHGLLKSSKEETLKPIEIQELLSQEMFDVACKESTCFLLFVPDIRDSSKEKREEMIATLRTVADKQHRGLFNFAWVAGSIQSEMEEKLTLGFGYPAVVVINGNKERFAVQTSSFTENNLNVFINGLQSGSVRTKVLPTLPSFVAVEPWNGEDAPQIEEPDYDFEEEI